MLKLLLEFSIYLSICKTSYVDTSSQRYGANRFSFYRREREESVDEEESMSVHVLSFPLKRDLNSYLTLEAKESNSTRRVERKRQLKVLPKSPTDPSHRQPNQRQDGTSWTSYDSK